jgi:RHS repeat-associated protein
VVLVPNEGTSGLVQVVVHTSSGASNPKSFTVIPSIKSLSPSLGPVGASVTITGTNFGATQGTSTVTFNGTTGTPTSWGATSIVVPVPSGATTGNVVVTVSGVASNGMNFTVGTTTGPTVYYYLEDALGTSRVITTNTGVICYDADFYPFGGERPVTDSCTQNNYKFTGKERDSESGLDNFGARYFAPTTGRFMTPDWSDSPESVPYADFENPQTLNLYSYVQNNPVSRKDATGHYHCDPDTATWGPNGVTVTAGACHNDWWDFQWLKNWFTARQPVRRPRQTFEQYLQENQVRTEIPIGPGGFLEDLRALSTAEELMRARPVWANTAGGFVNWLKNLQKADMKLTAEQADAIVKEANNLKVEVINDPPHPGTNWDVQHLNIGSNGQVHLEVPGGYSNPLAKVRY